MNFVERSTLSQGATNLTGEIAIPTDQQLSSDKQESLDALSRIPKIQELCSAGVIDYYPGKVLS